LHFVLFLVRLGNGLGSSEYCRQSKSETDRTFHGGMAALRHFLDIVLVAPRRGFVHMTLLEMIVGAFDMPAGRLTLPSKQRHPPVGRTPTGSPRRPPGVAPS